MGGQMIEAEVLQEATRPVFELLQRIHGLPKEELVPVDEAAEFTCQMRKVFAAPHERCIFQAPCIIELPPDPIVKGPSKKTK